MGSPYSLDLRERVVAAVAGGMSRAEAARRFDVSHSSAIRWTQRAAETGALPMGGKKPFALADEEAWIRARVAEKPDITGRELLAELTERGVEVSYYGVWHFLDHIGLSFKKSLRASERDRADVARRRGQWKEWQGAMSAARLIFVDETWAKTNMTRCTAAILGVSDWSRRSRMGHAKHSPSSPVYAVTVSSPHVYSMGRSRPKASSPGSSSSWSRACDHAISW
jgi:transposase